MIRELTETEFKETFGQKMINVTSEDLDPIDIWVYVKELKDQTFIDGKTFDRKIVEYVYRNDKCTFDHVLIPRKHKNEYVVIIVDLEKNGIHGHYFLDLNNEYGLK